MDQENWAQGGFAHAGRLPVPKRTESALGRGRIGTDSGELGSPMSRGSPVTPIRFTDSTPGNLDTESMESFLDALVPNTEP